MDEIARQIGMDRIEFRRLNVVVPGDPMTSAEDGPHDVEYGSYGLDQCLDRVETALANGPSHNLSDEWLVGRGVAAGMIDTIPPRGHRAESRVTLLADGTFELKTGTAEFGNGTTTVHCQIVASLLGTTPAHVRIKQSDTDHIGHDTGAFGSTGTVVAGSATREAAEDLAGMLLDFTASFARVRRSDCRFDEGAVVAAGRRIALADLARAAAESGAKLSGQGRSGGTPRSVAFNVQGFEVAVHRRYGEIRILRSVHAADAGTVMNLMQCRGQVEGGVAQAIGAALYEDLKIDGEGRSPIRPSGATTFPLSPTSRKPRFILRTPMTGSVRSVRSL